MTDMTGWETHGRSSCQTHDHSRLATGPERDCSACLADFEQTQARAEQLRIDLVNAHKASGGPLHIDAIHHALFTMLPGRKGSCQQGLPDEYRDGWNRCVDEMETRLKAFLAAD